MNLRLEYFIREAGHEVAPPQPPTPNLALARPTSHQHHHLAPPQTFCTKDPGTNRSNRIWHQHQHQHLAPSSTLHQHLAPCSTLHQPPGQVRQVVLQSCSDLRLGLDLVRPGETWQSWCSLATRHPACPGGRDGPDVVSQVGVRPTEIPVTVRHCGTVGPPASSVQPPVFSHQHPATSIQLPAPSHQHPASSHQLPATSHLHQPPTTRHQP